jgi:hypothetical protein
MVNTAFFLECLLSLMSRETRREQLRGPKLVLPSRRKLTASLPSSDEPETDEEWLAPR